jgi:hypothetical protein
MDIKVIREISGLGKKIFTFFTLSHFHSSFWTYFYFFEVIILFFLNDN